MAAAGPTPLPAPIGGRTEMRAADALQQMFPQVDGQVVSAVLEHEGTQEAAVDALLRSSGQDDLQSQIQRDEHLARELQGSTSYASTTAETWDTLWQAASDVGRTVSDGLAAITQNVSLWLHDDEYETELEAHRSLSEEGDVKPAQVLEALQETKKEK